jgi:hypothetical protein
MEKIIRLETIGELPEVIKMIADKEQFRYAESYNREKAMWSLDQKLQVYEATVIRIGCLLKEIKRRESPSGFSESLKRIGPDLSEELAEVYIQAAEEDANG